MGGLGAGGGLAERRASLLDASFAALTCVVACVVHSEAHQPFDLRRHLRNMFWRFESRACALLAAMTGYAVYRVANATNDEIGCSILYTICSSVLLYHGWRLVSTLEYSIPDRTRNEPTMKPAQQPHTLLLALL